MAETVKSLNCPQCSAPIAPTMSVCVYCGSTLSFEVQKPVSKLDEVLNRGLDERTQSLLESHTWSALEQIAALLERTLAGDKEKVAKDLEKYHLPTIASYMRERPELAPNAGILAPIIQGLHYPENAALFVYLDENSGPGGLDQLYIADVPVGDAFKGLIYGPRLTETAHA